MLIAMVMVPIVALLKLNGWDTFHDIAQMKPTNLDLFRGTTVLGIVSLFSWGLGYFGQPHIIVRFMSIKSHKLLPKARRLGNKLDGSRSIRSDWCGINKFHLYLKDILN